MVISFLTAEMLEVKLSHSVLFTFFAIDLIWSHSLTKLSSTRLSYSYSIWLDINCRILKMFVSVTVKNSLRPPCLLTYVTADVICSIIRLDNL